MWKGNNRNKTDVGGLFQISGAALLQSLESTGCEAGVLY